MDNYNYNTNSISIAFIEFIKLMIRTYVHKKEIKCIDNIYTRFMTIENDNLEIEEKNNILNLKLNNHNQEKNIYNNDIVNLDKIYKNYNLTSDILFHSLIGIYILGVNCFFNTGLQNILHSYNFILDYL